MARPARHQGVGSPAISHRVNHNESVDKQQQAHSGSVPTSWLLQCIHTRSVSLPTGCEAQDRLSFLEASQQVLGSNVPAGVRSCMRAIIGMDRLLWTTITAQVRVHHLQVCTFRIGAASQADWRTSLDAGSRPNDWDCSAAVRVDHTCSGSRGCPSTTQMDWYPRQDPVPVFVAVMVVVGDCWLSAVCNIHCWFAAPVHCFHPAPADDEILISTQQT